MKKIIFVLFLAASVALFQGIESAQAAPAIIPEHQAVQLHAVDGSGVYSLPSGFTALNIDGVYCDGYRADYVPVKDGTEIDIPLARHNSNVAAIIKK